MIRTRNGSLFYPVQGRDVDMDYKTYPFVYDNKIRQAVAVDYNIGFGLYNGYGCYALAGTCSNDISCKRRSGGKFGL